jgi:hypothetical protein
VDSEGLIRKKGTIRFARHWTFMREESDVPVAEWVEAPTVVIDNPSLSAQYWIKSIRTRLALHGPGHYIGYFYGEKNEKLDATPWRLEITLEESLDSGWSGPND